MNFLQLTFWSDHNWKISHHTTFMSTDQKKNAVGFIDSPFIPIPFRSIYSEIIVNKTYNEKKNILYM